MKKAKTIIVCVSAVCPHCEADLYEPDSGSLNIPINQFNKDHVFVCYECGKKCQLESKAFK